MARFAPSGPRRRGLPEPPSRTVIEVTYAGTAYPVAIKRVAVARRFTLRVRAATRDAILTMPPRASMRTARSFAERHAEWIGARLDGLPASRPILAGTLVPLRGREHLVVHDPTALRRNRVICEAGQDDAGTPHLRVTGSPERVGPLVMAFLRREALHDLREAASRHASAAGVVFDRIVLRDTRSRWGSCSSRGTLSFSWRLVMAPPHVLDYLAAHEVAHLRHMNHSAAFWTLADRLAPRLAEAETWLKAHGPTLHLYTAGEELSDAGT